jgi:thioredoxin reductase (NADPH)
MEDIYDVIILGAGPAGLSAGIYASRAKLKTLILNEGTVGGQVILTHEIANYPGVETTNGFKLVNTMKKQAKEFGCIIKANLNVTGINLLNKIKEIKVNGSDIYKGKTVILALGGKPRSLNIPGEDDFKGRGVSYCATCDGEFFTGKEVVVVGGGNSALEESVSLAKYASKLTVVHQFDHFQAQRHYIDMAKNNPKINFIMGSELRGIEGEASVKKVKIENLTTGQISELNTDGVFIFIGYSANVDKVKDTITLNSRSEIVVDNNMKTNIEGVYAAGDCIEKRYRQVTTAVADGTIAALSVSDYLMNSTVSKEAILI